MNEDDDYPDGFYMRREGDKIIYGITPETAPLGKLDAAAVLLELEEFERRLTLTRLRTEL
jgi:hypothetical protein